MKVSEKEVEEDTPGISISKKPTKLSKIILDDVDF